MVNSFTLEIVTQVAVLLAALKTVPVMFVSNVCNLTHCASTICNI